MSDLQRPRRPLLPLAALALSVWAGVAGAQSAPPVRSFGETVDVRVVNLEAVVTDKDGLPITGLEPGDFKLEIDGRQVPIGYFTEVRGGQAVVPQASEAGDAAFPGMPTLAPGTPVGTSYLVFIDEYFSVARDRDQVLRRMVQDLPRLGPEDRMALVAFDGKGLTLLSSWSSSPSALERAFRTALGRPSYGIQRVTELRTLENERRDFVRLGLQFEGTAEGRLESFELDFAQRLERQLQSAIAAAAATLRGFAAPPGRKVMLLLSGGWPFEVGEYAAGDDFPRYTPDTTLARGTELYAPLADTANQLGYTVYSVDVPGLASPAVDAEVRTQGEAQINGGVHFERKANIQQTLNQIARQTGGRALLNSQRLDAFVVAQSDTRSYYWLGFSPTWKGDDDRHRVKLSVMRPGLRLRTREDYVDISRQREVSMAVESGLLFGAPPSTDLLELELGETQSGKRGRMTLPFTVSVPGDQLTFVPEAGSLVAQLELRVAAIDDRGDRSEIPVIPISIRARRAAQPGEKVTFQNSVELRRGKQRVLFSLFDPLSGRMFTAVRELKP